MRKIESDEKIRRKMAEEEAREEQEAFREWAVNVNRILPNEDKILTKYVDMCIRNEIREKIEHIDVHSQFVLLNPDGDIANVFDNLSHASIETRRRADELLVRIALEKPFDGRLLVTRTRHRDAWMSGTPIIFSWDGKEEPVDKRIVSKEQLIRIASVTQEWKKKKKEEWKSRGNDDKKKKKKEEQERLSSIVDENPQFFYNIRMKQLRDRVSKELEQAKEYVRQQRLQREEALRIRREKRKLREEKKQIKNKE